jgi:hypothetical protein
LAKKIHVSNKTGKLQATHDISQLIDSANRGELVVVVGSGISVALTNGTIPSLSWKGLIENGFEYGVNKAKISVPQKNSWKSQLDSGDLDDLLSAAEFMARKLGSPDGDLYGRWFEKVFKSVRPSTGNSMGERNGDGALITGLRPIFSHFSFVLIFPSLVKTRISKMNNLYSIYPFLNLDSIKCWQNIFLHLDGIQHWEF